jgi:murein L,D-transpeptidase YcbB/YkuD
MKRQLNLNDGFKPVSTLSTILLTCIFFMLLMCAVITAASANQASKALAVSNNDLSAEIKKQLNEPNLYLNFPVSTKRFYEQRKFQPTWVTATNGAKPTWDAMLMMDCVLQYGLNHNDYHPTELFYDRLHDILERPNEVSADKKARFEIMLTDALLTFSNYLHYGKFNPAYTGEQIDTEKTGSFKATGLLAKAVNSTSMMAVIESAQPQSEAYRNLQSHMHLIAGVYVGDCYEYPEANIRKMAINMERLRWVNMDGPNYVQINIPSYLLQFYHSGTIDTFKVAAGKQTSTTPGLTSLIRGFTVAPEKKIAAKTFIQDLLPKAIKDTAYLRKNHYAIYNYSGQLLHPNKPYLIKIKQNPGRYYARRYPKVDDALGVIVFNFQNEYNLAMHDVPADYKNLFNKDERSVTKGNIYVEHAQKLAAKLLTNDKAADQVSLMQKSIASYRTKTFAFKNPIPINVTYLTCEVKEGKLIIYKDIYNLDKSLEIKVYANDQAIATR